MLEDKLSLKLSFLCYKLVFINIQANTCGIGIIITIIIRLTLWGSVSGQRVLPPQATCVQCAVWVVCTCTKKFGELNLEKLFRRLVDGLFSNACCMTNVLIYESGGIHYQTFLELIAKPPLLQ